MTILTMAQLDTILTMTILTMAQLDTILTMAHMETILYYRYLKT